MNILIINRLTATLKFRFSRKIVIFVFVNLGAVRLAANPRYVVEMPNKDIHKKGFSPEPPEGCDLSKERILLHCCCAPCSTAIIEWMVGAGLRPGIFFSNSNIVPFREYSIRRGELCRYAAAHGLETIDDEYNHSAWLDFVRRLETAGNMEVSPQTSGPTTSVAETVIRIADMPERGPRCLECFKFRLIRAADYASSHGYTLLTTTLASSRWKDLKQVDTAGEWACGRTNSQSPGTKVVWWNQNWRRGGLQERRGVLIKEWAMYNQTFCGCEFSERHQTSISSPVF